MKTYKILCGFLSLACLQAREQTGEAEYAAAHEQVVAAAEEVLNGVVTPAQKKAEEITKKIDLGGAQEVLKQQHDHARETARFVKFMLPLMKLVATVTKSVMGFVWRVTAGPSVAVDAVAIYYDAETGVCGVILGERPDKNGNASGKLAMPGGFMEVTDEMNTLYVAECGNNYAARTCMKELAEEVGIEICVLLDNDEAIVTYTPTRDVRQVMSICHGFLTNQFPQSSVELRNVRIVSFEELAELVKDSKNFAFDHGEILNKKLVQLAANKNLPESLRLKIVRCFAPAA